MFRAVSVWVIQASRKKETIFSSVGICCDTALSSVEAPAGYHNKVEKQKARGGKMGRGKRREQASVFPSHRAPRAFFFLVPRPPYDKKRRGLCGGAERGATERIFRQIRDREQQKFWDFVHAYPDIFKTEIFFSIFEKKWHPVNKKRQALETRIGILSNDDDDDGENVSLKVNSCCFKIYHSYSMAFNLSNAGKCFCSWILRDCI